MNPTLKFRKIILFFYKRLCLLVYQFVLKLALDLRRKPTANKWKLDLNGKTARNNGIFKNDQQKYFVLFVQSGLKQVIQQWDGTKLINSYQKYVCLWNSKTIYIYKTYFVVCIKLRVSNARQILINECKLDMSGKTGRKYRGFKNDEQIYLAVLSEYTKSDD